MDIPDISDRHRSGIDFNYRQDGVGRTAGAVLEAGESAASTTAAAATTATDTTTTTTTT